MIVVHPLEVAHPDLQVQSYLWGCRALGLTNKFVTGLLWRLLESRIHLLDLNKHYQKMCLLFFDLSVDASEFMLGNAIFLKTSKSQRIVFITLLLFYQIFLMTQLNYV